MKRKKKPIGNKKERVVLSDVLPYELPITFSNWHFYKFLVDNKIEIDDLTLKWKKGDSSLTEIIKLLFGIIQKNIESETDDQIVLKEKGLVKIPFGYDISHKENDFRELTIIHPINQLALIEFYDKYKELILYYCNVSPFSIRKPHKIAKLKYHKDKTHFDILAHDHEHETLEELEKEYENLKSFFVYKNYSNVYKFYESYKYQRCEKKYDKMFKFDISKCFDSIYTHSISWALLGKEIVKDKIKASKKTFGGIFDRLMQNLNYDETNGIVIGPEFSRIFAEIILQQIDANVLRLFKKQEPNLRYKRDYEIFRYVDDFFIFYNEEKTKEDILKIYRLQLKEYKLYINDSKSITLEKPIITGLTRAKQQISDLLENSFVLKLPEKKEARDEAKEKIAAQYLIYTSSNKPITRFKAIIKETDIVYKDILNYTLACIDRKVLKLIKTCSKIEDKIKQESKVTKAILELLDFTFFLYSVSPRVNTTIKLSMILSKLIKFAKNRNYFNYNNKHLIFKKIYDEISLVLNKSKNSEHVQVETLYLLIALKEMGRDYRVDEVLYDYFNINRKDGTCNLNYFSISVLLFYIENRVRYNNLRDILKTHIMEKFKKVRKENRGKMTELTLLLFDLLACPYFEEPYKKELLSLYGIDEASVQTGIIYKRNCWFTQWTEFDFVKVLDEKRSEEVY